VSLQTEALLWARQRCSSVCVPTYGAVFTLDCKNWTNPQFVFKASTLITAANTDIALKNVAPGAIVEIVWILSTATLGAGSTFRGNILATAAVAVGEKAIVLDRITAGAAVTLGAGAKTLEFTTGAAVTVGTGATTGDFTAGAAVTVGAGATIGLVTCGASFISGANAVIQSIVAKAGTVTLGAGTVVTGSVTTNAPISFGTGAVAGAVVLGSP
jgi:hypothetical protein